MSDSVRLRPMEAADWAAVHSWASRPEYCRFQSWGPNTEQQTREFVAASVAAWSQDPQASYANRSTPGSKLPDVHLTAPDHLVANGPDTCMKYEGRQRQTMLIHDGWRDSEMFSMLEDEWRAG